MHYEIDQSGKIEQTAKNTVIAVTNSKNFAVLFSKKDKRKLEKHFKNAKRLKNYRYLAFSALLAFVINAIKPEHRIIIDKEYMGYEGLILERIFSYLKQMDDPKKYAIEFGFVGKKSLSHKLAYGVGLGKKKPNYKISYAEMLGLIFEKTGSSIKNLGA